MFERERYDPRIDGQWVPTDRTEPLIEPATGDPFASASLGTAETIDRAIDAAAASLGEWQSLSPSRRGEVLYRAAETLLDRQEQLAEIETRQGGKPLHESRFDVGASADFLQYFAGMADKIEGREIPVPSDRTSITTREPYGITGHVVPWNSPLILAARSFAPALACGNAVVAMVDQKTPITCLALAESLEEAGVPAGVVNVVPGDGRTGQALTGHEGVDSITFTGSVETGKEVLKACAETVTPSVVELGSKSPNIVMDDADVQQAAESAVTAGYINAGQQCFAGSRILVHSDVEETFMDAFLSAVDTLTVGDGLESDTDMGPLVSADQRQSVLEYVDIGQTEGARLRRGGEAPSDPPLADGFFVEPTVFDEVAPSMRIAREEIFGPVVSVLTFDGYDEMIEIANDTEYGLTAGIWTDSVETAHRAIDDLEFGVVSVNEYPATWAQTPFGGFKQSGIGREKGQVAVEQYTQIKNATINFE